MWGLMSWFAAGATALILGRLLHTARRPGPGLDAVLALAGAVAAGLAATALDFGGWKEADPRAFLFALFSSLALLGIVRALKLL